MKRKSRQLQKTILEAIKKAPGITMSSLERKIGTNPASLREHCESLEELGLIKIERTEKTTKLSIKKH